MAHLEPSSAPSENMTCSQGTASSTQRPREKLHKPMLEALIELP